MKLVVSFLATILLLAGGAFAASSENSGEVQPIRIACVGDSITVGMGIGKGFDYPSQLQDRLGSGWKVGNFGVSGRTLLRKGDYPYWNENAFHQAQAFHPDVVIILLGANDTKPQNWVHVSGFLQDYTDLVKTFQALPSHPKVYVCRPCPVPEPGNYGINETNIREEIKMVDQVARNLQLPVIDLHGTLEKSPHVFPDRVHPNSKGAALIADTVYTALTGKNAADLIQANSYFSDHAILQRGAPHPVWGIAPNGTAITVTFSGQTISTIAQDGKWKVTLQPLEASATPQTLTIKTVTKEISIKDILVGDVWLAGGQSNMERQLGPRPPQKEIIGAQETIAAADLPLIRQFYVPQRVAEAEVEDVYGNWTLTTPGTAEHFSAVAFFFARDLQPKIGVPLGIIHSSWGGTLAEAWMSPEAVVALGDLANRSAKVPNLTSGLYHTMLKPLLPAPIKGVIWYQGESNNDRPLPYRKVFPALIEDWRKQYHDKKLPFLFVQIAPFGKSVPELREAQFLTLQHTPHTAMVVTMDVGDAADIHPADKGPVGRRLALAARAVAYGENIEYSGPLYRAMKVSGASIILEFDHTGSGLASRAGELRGFTIAGSDGDFLPATAVVEGDKIRVTSAQVSAPVAVRYGWGNVPEGNLMNKEGLPASPFRTDVK